jgi:hypothetical protein
MRHESNIEDRDHAFGFWLPIEKGGVKEENGERLIYGVTSTEDLDLDDEIVSASGLKKSLDYFIRHGRLDYDHKSKDEPKYIIGEPIEGKFDDQNRMHIKGRIYKGMQIADQCWELLKAGTTRLGWSVGGKILKKSLCFDKSLGRMVPKVTEALINHIALTPHPKNVHTHATATAYGSFMKSLAAPESTLGTIINLDGKEYVLASRDELEKAISSAGGTALGTNPVITQSLESDIKVLKNFITLRNRPDDPEAVLNWFKSQGIDSDKADAFAAVISKNADRIKSETK